MHTFSQADSTAVLPAAQAAELLQSKTAAAQMRGLVSIHDVMPCNLAEVTELLQLCVANRIKNPTLLIVPGLDWSPSQMLQLRDWQRQGCELAGHGWVHRCESIRGLGHRLHSACLSRDVAEHLSLSRAEILQLMRRCGHWFEDHGFTLPDLYVPPAWALGRLKQSDLREQPFRMIETISGVVFADGRRQYLPLLGFEADTWPRKLTLSCWNRLTRSYLTQSSCVRIAIHPFDHRLKLANDLERSLKLPMHHIHYSTLAQRLR